MGNELPYARSVTPSDDERGTLRLLGIFYSVIGGFELAGAMILPITSWQDAPIPHAVMLLICGCAAAFTLSGVFMLWRRLRFFSFGIAICYCFLFPMGTILGAWTIVVLTKPGVRQIYLERCSQVAR
jgi:hypothetical protein